MLARFWRWLFHSCEHTWETVVVRDVWDEEGSSYPIGQKYVLRCTKCGDIKVRKTY